MNVEEIRRAVTLAEVIPAVERAFVAYVRKKATVPSVMHLDFPSHGGEVHVKAAHLHGDREYVIKVASGFLANREKGIPYASGLMMIFSAETGYPIGMLIDNAYLTDLRTAAAGGIAAKYMATNDVEQVGVLGAGVQGRLQLEALMHVRTFSRVVIYDHHSHNVQRYLEEMKPKVNADIRPAANAEAAVRNSRIIITATPARKPLIMAEWVEPGTHITAMGSDGADKQELHTALLAKADRIIADSIAQCSKFGELHHALQDGSLSEDRITGELGDVIGGKVAGRMNEWEITICDLTGVGVQDAAIAGLVYRRAAESGIGQLIEV